MSNLLGLGSKERTAYLAFEAYYFERDDKPEWEEVRERWLSVMEAVTRAAEGGR